MKWRNVFTGFPCRAGDAMFLPSGRVHAIGAGFVIFEIQQNSDTTYRVFDWNRLGLDGRSRELHMAQSLASIDFNDFEPALVQNRFTGGRPNSTTFTGQPPAVQDRILENEIRRGQLLKPKKTQIIAVQRASFSSQGGSVSVDLSAGQFCLIPAGLEQTEICEVRRRLAARRGGLNGLPPGPASDGGLHRRAADVRVNILLRYLQPLGRKKFGQFWLISFGHSGACNFSFTTR